LRGIDKERCAFGTSRVRSWTLGGALGDPPDGDEEAILTARDVWRWTDERGIQRLVGTDELRAALAGAILPASTLVWREGMKEWVPASTVPELASAAFAGGEKPAKASGEKPGSEALPTSDTPKPPIVPAPKMGPQAAPNPAPAAPAPKVHAIADEPSDGDFDARATLKESERRSTLVGLTSPASSPTVKNVAVPVAVPAPRSGDAAEEPSERPGITQVPPFGAPSPEDAAPAVPPAPRVPAPPKPNSGLNPPPKRKPLTSEIDGNWATTTHSDEDETIPRRARPSELAAAAAAAAEAAMAMREARSRAAEALVKPVEPASQTAKSPAPPAKKPPPHPRPVPAAKPAEKKAEAKPNGEEPAPHPGARPPPRPLMKTLSGVKAPTLPPRAMPEPAPAPPSKPAIPPIGPLSAPAKPAVPTVRIKPPSMPPPPAEPRQELGSLEDLARAAVNVPFNMGTPGTPPYATTLTGVSAAKVPSDAKAAGNAPPPLPGETSRITKTLVSPNDSGPSLAQAAVELAIELPEVEEVPANGASHAVAVAPVDAPPAAPTLASPSAAPDKDPSRSNGAEAPVAAGTPEPPPAHPLPPPRPPPRPPQTSRPPAATPTPTPPPASVEPAPKPAKSVPPAAKSVPPPAGDFETEVRRKPSGRPLDEHVSVPVSSLLGAGGVLISMVVAAFFVGRASSSPPPLTARPALAAIPKVARAALPAPPKPCWMVKQPAMWAPHASKSIPFDAIATTKGTLAIGYARSAKQAMGIEVNLATGAIEARFDDKADEEIERVTPTPALAFKVARAGDSGPLKGPIDVPAATPFALGIASGAIAIATGAGAAPLWPLEGDEGLGAASVHEAGDSGFLLTFRRGGAIWGGFLGPDRKAQGALTKVVGSGGAVGKPSGAWNGREIAVIFADRPDADGRYEVRVAHGPPGAIPATATVFPLPKGGPGGDAFAPDIAGLPDGRWLLMWTEGAAGSRAVRAQTLAPDFTPLGDPIALSPPAGNFGQGVIGVAGGYAATVFLSKGSSSYELWGAVLQCG
jgi:hypothetical protein